jgi:ABC-type uncharacterized transport system permease subunit
MYLLLQQAYQIIAYRFKALTTYFWNDMGWLLGRFISFFVSLVIWSISDRQDASEIINLLLIGNIYFSAINADLVWNIHDSIYSGKISSNLITPIPLLLWEFIKAIADLIKDGFSSLLVAIIPLLAFASYFEVEWRHLLLLVFLPFSFVIRFFVQTSISMNGFFMREGYGIISLYQSTEFLLLGLLIPWFTFGDSWLAKIISWNPLSSAIYHPVRAVLSGDTTYMMHVFVINIIWSLVLIGIAQFILRIGLKQYESVGL